jgi:hypothetical protein
MDQVNKERGDNRMTEKKSCPKCGKSCDRDEVDIGVGTQYGPWCCNWCGWSEDKSLQEPYFDLNEEDK